MGFILSGLRLKIIAGIIIILALIVGIWAGVQHRKNNSFSESASTIFSPPQPVANFSLIDSKGRPFNNNSLWGHWTFVFFGFTGCTQICPPAMANLNKMYNILLAQKQNPMPQIVFVSIDPDNDTLAKLGEYVTAFNPHFQGATGDPAQLDKLAASLNIIYINHKKNNSAAGSKKKPQEEQDLQNMIDHSGSILLIDPAGKLIAIFSMPHDPAAMAKDFVLILKNSG